MTKTLLALSGALLLAAPSFAHAQGTRSFSGGGGAHATTASPAAHSYGASHYGSYRHGGYYGGYGHGGYSGHRYGRYYYLGGVPYFYPYYGAGFGFGYPYYAYNGYWDGYYGGPTGYNPNGVYEGRVTDQQGSGGASDQQEGSALPMAVQRQLVKRGYYKGTVDGDFGPASRSALSHFQRDNRLKETGRIDEDTLQALGFADRR